MADAPCDHTARARRCCSRTARRIFWYLLACAIGAVLVRWLQSLEGIGMMWVFLSAVSGGTCHAAAVCIALCCQYRRCYRLQFHGGRAAAGLAVAATCQIAHGASSACMHQTALLAVTTVSWQVCHVMLPSPCWLNPFMPLLCRSWRLP